MDLTWWCGIKVFKEVLSSFPSLETLHIYQEKHEFSGYIDLDLTHQHTVGGDLGMIFEELANSKTKVQKIAFYKSLNPNRDVTHHIRRKVDSIFETNKATGNILSFSLLFLFLH